MSNKYDKILGEYREEDTPDLSGYVPYSGATADLDLGAFDLLCTDLTMQGKQIIDITDTEAFLVRKNADGGDLLAIDTSNLFLWLYGSLYIETDSSNALFIRRNTGDVNQFGVDCANQAISSFVAHHFYGHIYAEDDPMYIYDSNSNELVAFDTVASAENYLGFANAADGNGGEINALGDDTNVDVEINPKGTGGVACGGTGTSIFQEGVTINEGGSDSDTRIESDTDTNCLFVDASTNRVGIGMSSPAEKLDVTGNVKLSGELLGCRELLTQDRTSIGTASAYMGSAALAYTATVSIPMVRAGSIVGISACLNVTAQTTQGNINVHVYKNGASVYSIAIASNGIAVVTGQGTQARGTDTFVAGDLITAYVELGTGILFVGTIALAVTTIEVVYNT